MFVLPSQSKQTVPLSAKLVPGHPDMYTDAQITRIFTSGQHRARLIFIFRWIAHPKLQSWIKFCRTEQMKEIENISKYFNATMRPLCHFTKRIDLKGKFPVEAKNLRKIFTLSEMLDIWRLYVLSFFIVEWKENYFRKHFIVTLIALWTLYKLL